jgi:hypothetical protein
VAGADAEGGCWDRGGCVGAGAAIAAGGGAAVGNVEGTCGDGGRTYATTGGTFGAGCGECEDEGGEEDATAGPALSAATAEGAGGGGADVSGVVVSFRDGGGIERGLMAMLPTTGAEGLASVAGEGREAERDCAGGCCGGAVRSGDSCSFSPCIVPVVASCSLM